MTKLYPDPNLETQIFFRTRTTDRIFCIFYLGPKIKLSKRIIVAGGGRKTNLIGPHPVLGPRRV